ncbi:MAG TPA: glycosyltransferase family 2 protein, partial [Thermoleophilaceae bacterium]|nr:glycosyltransferase family 2 protein [Thermoleophilaceae bacterium]
LVSVVIPALNEAESIEACVRRSLDTMKTHGIAGEVVVSDNGSDDGTPELARAAGARVIHEQRKGYGSAYLAGFAAARGKYIVMGDADETYDFGEIARFVEPLEEGADLVMGSRLRGHIHPGAMPWLHRYVGNPVLTGVLNLFFRTGVSDAHCGMRAFRRDLLPRLDLRTTGMEFASEQVIRSSKLGLDIREIPIEYHPRTGESKLSSFSDGWRHLRFLLVHSPTWLFLVPGLLMIAIGAAAGAISLFNLPVFGRQWQLHALIAASMLAIVGAQVAQLGVSARTYAFYYLGEHDPLFDRLRARLRLEHGLIAGTLIGLVGFVMALVVLIIWIHRGFGELREEKLAVAGLALVVIGIQTVFGAFFLSILGLRRRSRSLEDPQPPAAG